MTAEQLLSTGTRARVPRVAARLAALLTPTLVSAQDAAPRSADRAPRVVGGLALAVGQPVGQFRKYVDRGLGLDGHVMYRLDGRGRLALRLEGGALNYGRETLRVPLGTNPGSGRVQLAVTTSNDLVWLGAGPRLMLPRGPVRPYADATAGITYFTTRSTARGTGVGSLPFAQTTNHDDLQLSWSAGAGVLVPLTFVPRRLVALDLGASYRDNGRRVGYVREGGVRDLPDGGVQVGVVRSRADLVTWRAGVAVGAR